MLECVRRSGKTSEPAHLAPQVLLSVGYKYVDVRPAFEWDDFGHAAQAVNVPVMHMERKWSSEEQKKVRVLHRPPLTFPLSPHSWDPGTESKAGH